MSKKRLLDDENDVKNELESGKEATTTSNGIQEVWNFFSSMKLGLILLLAIAVASIVGTLLPQNPETRMPIYDIYQSLWYRALLAALCLNLVVCSLNRVKFIARSLGQPKIKANENFLKKLSNYTVIKERVDQSTAAKKLTNALSTQGYRVYTEEADANVYIAADKGRFGVVGSFVAHLSFVIIALGAILGNVTGWETYVAAPEGEVFDLKTHVIRGAFEYPDADNFQVKVNDFRVEFQPDGSTPKDFFSDLSVLENGQEVMRKTIEVNTPLEYKGVKFYQSSYGPMIDVTYKGSGGAQTFTVEEGQTIPIPGTDTQVTVMRYIPDYNPNNPMQTNSMDPKNPAVVYKITKGGQQQDMNVKMFKEPISVSGGTIEFSGRYYTGLSVRKDPGVPVVITGCILLVAGTFISLFWQHRKIWGIVRQQNNMVSVELGGVTEKNKLALENDFNRVVDSLKS